MVCAFFLVVYLRGVIYGSKCVYVVIEVLGKFWWANVISEGS